MAQKGVRVFPLCICLIVACCLRGGNAFADELPEKVPYTLKLALGGELVPMDASAEEVRKSLAGIFSAEAPEEAVRLMAQLGSVSAPERERASRGLLKYLESHPVSVSELIKGRLESEDPEVRLRCRALWLKRRQPNLDGILERILMDRMVGMLGVLEAAPESFWEGHREWRLPDIVEGVAREEDLKRLKAWREHRLPVFRRAAVRAMGKLGATDDLMGSASDSDAHVRLEVALQLGKASDKRSIGIFKNLVTDDDFLVRSVSAYALEALSGKFFGFPGTANAKEIGEIAEKWRNLEIVAPRFPLRLPGSTLSNAPAGSHLFILPNGPGEVRKYDRDGDLVKGWKNPFSDQASDLIPLSGGRLLMGGNTVDREYSWKLIGDDSRSSRGGNRTSYPCPSSLTNGNILLCDYSEVVELDPDGGQVFTLPLKGVRGRNAWRTRYGTTLVASSSAVSEFDWKGELVWNHAFDGDYLICCQGLPNGNILMVMRGGNRVIEMTHDHKEVWEWRSKRGRVRDCFMLPSNSLLVATDLGAKEVGRDGSLHWEIPGGGIWQVRRGE